MTEDVAAKGREQYGIPFTSQKYLIVTVPRDTTESFVQCSLMLWIAKAVHENKVCITINRSGTTYAVLLLVLAFFQKGILYKIQHWYLANTVGCLWRMDITITAILSMIVVNQSVIHVNHTFIQVNIAPSQSNNFTNTHPGANHNSENRIPMSVSFCAFQVVKKQILFCLSQRTPLLYFGAGLFQFLQNII